MLKEVSDSREMAENLVAKIVHENYLVGLKHNHAFLESIKHSTEPVSRVVAHSDFLRGFIQNTCADIAKAWNHQTSVSDAHDQRHRGMVCQVIEYESGRNHTKCHESENNERHH